MKTKKLLRFLSLACALLLLAPCLSCTPPTGADGSGTATTTTTTAASGGGTPTKPGGEEDMYEGRTKVKVMSYNIRSWRGDEPDDVFHVFTDDEMNQLIADIDVMLTREDPDILIVCEDRTFFDTHPWATEGGEKEVYELMLKKYFPYAYYVEDGPNIPHIYSKHELKNIRHLPVNYPEGTEDRRKPTMATVTIDGRDIEIIACHSISGKEYADTNRVAYFNAIVNYAKYQDHVIIAGDMNTDSLDPLAEYKPFIDAKFKLGNFGEFGEFVTYRFGAVGNKIDNIIVRGFAMKSFYVGEEIYSDHFPVYAELYLPRK